MATPKRSPLKSKYRIAACAFIGSSELVAKDRIQLFPAGEFRALDGRPADVSAWRMDADIAARLIAAADLRGNRYMLDYDHAVLYRDKGVKAIAAAWFKKLEWVEGVGLFAVDVEWTATAAQHVAAAEYGYISPLFQYDPKTGAVIGLINAALTSIPALDDMEEVFEAVAASLVQPDSQSLEESHVEELIEQLRWLLNLPVGASVEDIRAQLQKIMEQLGTTPTAAASFDLGGHLAALSAQVAAEPDPTRFVPVDTHQAVANELAALSAQVRVDRVGGLVTAALADGRLNAHQEAWARGAGEKDLASLEAFLATATPNPALVSMQTAALSQLGKAPGSAGGGDGDAQSIATAALAYQVEQAGKGVSITTTQAVRHVESTRSK